MFTNVHKKFFTVRIKFENNPATSQPARCLTPPEGSLEMHELKDTFTRNAATLPRDFAGVAALVVIAFAGLSLPGFF